MINSFIDSHDAEKKLPVEKILETSAATMKGIFEKLERSDEVMPLYEKLRPVRENGRRLATKYLKEIQDILKGIDAEIVVSTAVNLMLKTSDIDVMVIVEGLNKDVEKVLAPIRKALLDKGYRYSGQRGIPGKPGHWITFNGFDFVSNVEIEVKIRDKDAAGDIVSVHNTLIALDEPRSAVIVYMKHKLSDRKWTYALFKNTMYEWIYNSPMIKKKRLFSPPPGGAWRIGLLQENPEKPLEWKKRIWEVELQ